LQRPLLLFPHVPLLGLLFDTQAEAAATASNNQL